MPFVLVAGGGIGGFAAALSLAEAGCTVEVVERSAELREAGAGLQLSPNATAILRGFGLLDRLLPLAVAPERVRIRRGRDAAELASLPLGAVAAQRFGAPFLVIHRADLLSVLAEAARAHPAIRVTTGESVESYRRDPGQLSVQLRKGEQRRSLQADGLIGADGLRSAIRNTGCFGADGAPAYCGRTAWRTLVPAEQVAAEMRQPTSNLWLGHRAHLVHYPVRGGALINVVAVVEDDWTGQEAADLWAVPGDRAKLRGRYAGWVAPARSLIEAAPAWRIWPLFDRPPLERWCDGPVALLGDAAHPMLPFLAQGAAQAIEDADALGRAVRAFPNDLARAFQAYGSARRPKAARVQRESRRQGTIYHLGRPAAAIRDFGLRRLGPVRMLARYDWLYGTGLPSI